MQRQKCCLRYLLHLMFLLPRLRSKDQKFHAQFFQTLLRIACHILTWLNPKHSSRAMRNEGSSQTAPQKQLFLVQRQCHASTKLFSLFSYSQSKIAFPSPLESIQLGTSGSSRLCLQTQPCIYCKILYLSLLCTCMEAKTPV